MRELLFMWFYVLIGLGVAAAEPRLPYPGPDQFSLAVVLWPSILTARAYGTVFDLPDKAEVLSELQAD